MSLVANRMLIKNDNSDISFAVGVLLYTMANICVPLEGS